MQKHSTRIFFLISNDVQETRSRHFVDTFEHRKQSVYQLATFDV